MKVFLWILGGLAALVVLLIAVVVGAGFFFGSSMAKQAKEAQAFSAHATHSDCADELARRASGCEGMSVSCIMDVSLFMGTCFRGAQGDRAQFCGTVPASTDQGAIEKWSGEFCPPRKLAKEQCSFVTAMISGLCSAPEGSEPATQPEPGATQSS